MKIYKVSDGTIDQTIQRSMDFSARHYGNHMQIEIKDKKKNESFLRLLNKLAEVTRIDALGGSRFLINDLRRHTVDKSFEDVIQHAETGIRTGLKTYHNPAGEIWEWDKWEGGYIEGFTRMDGDKEHGEYFIWTYIRMEHLRTILEEFQDDLEYFYF